MTVQQAAHGQIAPPLRVVIVDDHTLVRHGLRSLLESTGRVRVVGEAGTASDAQRVLAQERPDVVLLDLRLGLEDGIEVARAARAELPDVKLLVVSAHGSSAQLRAALAAGADGYLLKGVTAPELVDGLRRVAAGETVIDPAFVPTLLEDMAGGHAREDLLTVRETEVVALVADGLTTQAVARRLEVSDRTVQKHLENAYRKLGVASRAELVQQAFRRGVLR